LQNAGKQISRRQFVALAAATGTIHVAASPFHMDAQSKPLALQKVHLLRSGSPLPGPYAPLHDGSFSGAAVAESPDPLVRYVWSSPQSTDALQSYALAPMSSSSSEPNSFRHLGAETLPIRVEGLGSIRFDFGVESPAWLEFESDDFSGAVEMSVSEYDEPAVVNTGPVHRFKTTSPVRYGDTYRLELNAALYEGLRFGWIHVLQWERPWHIRAVRAVCQVKPANYAGSFACSDSMLTRIWYTGAYVVKANLCKDYFGSILMDRGDRISWTGDAHPSQSAAMAVFGNWDFVRENLKRTASDSNGIESYPLYWILSLAEYYECTGDREGLQQLMPQAETLLQHGAKIYPDPTIAFYGWDERLGAGFEEPNIAETKNAFRMLFIKACREFAHVARDVGNTTLASRYEALAQKKMEAARASNGGFTGFGLHALADAVNTGLLTENEAQAAYRSAFANRLDRLSYSPFNQYFILRAMTHVGRLEEALVSVRDMWGGQIDYGGSTFFETYTPSWNQAVGKNGAVPNCQAGYTSLGHPWGAGVVSWLSKEVLGIKATSVGFATMEFKPSLGTHLEWVSGSVPTPHGIASLEFNRISGIYRVTIPAGTKARVGIPVGAGAARRIRQNQKIVWDGTFHDTRGIAGATEDSVYVYLEEVQPGRYVFECPRGPSSMQDAIPPLTYVMQQPYEDRSTHGNWIGRYGQEGYVFFNYDGVEQHRSNLPHYVASVKPSKRSSGGCINVPLEGKTQDERAPKDDKSPKGPRKMGQLNTGDPQACQQSMTIDVQIKDRAAHQITLYCVDWEDLNRRQAIEVFDLDTLSRVAPVYIIGRFTQGCHLVYRCDRSVRFRINQIRGRNAVLNAIYFDLVPSEAVS
jgi:alpha-L-rhamnosidase